MLPPLSTRSRLAAILFVVAAGCAPRLEPGRAVAKSIAEDARQRLVVDLEADHFAHLVVHQESVDVVLTLRGPDGKPVGVELDATAPGDPEHVYFIPEEAGRYELEVHALDLPPEAQGKGRYTVVLEHHRPATANDRLVNEASWIEAEGLEAYAIEEDSTKAVEFYEKAIELWLEAGRQREAALVMQEQGNALNYIGDPAKGLERLLQALAIAEALDDDPFRLRLFVSLGLVYRSLGRYQDAIDIYSQAQHLSKALDDTKRQASTAGNLCVLFRDIGRLERAQKNCEIAIDIYRSLDLRADEFRALTNLGSALYSQGKLTEAIRCYETALSLNLGGNRRLQSSLLTHYARSLVAVGDRERAWGTFEQALALNQELREPTFEAHTRLSMAALLVETDRFEEARGHAEQARQLSKRAGKEVTEAHALGTLGAIAAQQGDIPAGLEKADQAFELLEKLRSDPRALDNRAAFLASRWSIYDLRVDLRMRMATLEPARQAFWHEAALAAAEEAKARGLMDMLAAAEPARLVTPAELRSEILEAGTLMLYFHLGQERGFLWSVSSETTGVLEIPAARQVQRLAADFYQALIEREKRVENESAESRAARIRAGDARSDKLGRELADLLRLREAIGPSDAERLLIAADGALHRIPFAALPWGFSPAAQAPEPLLAGFEIVQTPSASVLAALRRLPARSDPELGLVAFADPVFDAGDSRLPAGATQEGDREPFARLPLSREEAASIARIAPGRSLVLADFEANRAAARGPDLATYRYLHFATHGLLETAEPSQTALLLSRFSPDGSPIEGRLSLADLYDMKLSADLVVLSACRTARGLELRGEGLIGLTSGFMNAGVPRVVASLWTVQDGVTSALMLDFYRRMWRHGRRPAAALREAQLELWRRQLPAYYWAPFIFQGEWR